jgi:CubicO group peptidase (beta-lactamase class C family)
MHKLIIAGMGIVLLNITAIAQKPTDPRLKGLDLFAEKILKDFQAPGVSIAVVEKNKVIYTGGFGFRDVEKKLPVTANTLFAIGSCSKAFTASMLGMLAKEGLVDIDKPVRNYLPELKFKNDYTNKHITLRDMMSHRSGLPRHDASWYGSTATRNELLARIEYLEPSVELRQAYQYNNFMFMAQGVAIEKLTGKSWEQNIKERIFTPLGMTASVTSIADMEKSADRSLAYALENKISKAIPYRNIDAIGPAGSINSSANDMANWLITWINGGKFNGKEIIPQSFLTQAMTAQVATGGGVPGKVNPDIHMSAYGLGWGMASYRGHYRVEHGGGIDGFITTTGFFPSDSIGIFVVSSQSEVSIAIRNHIADKLLKLSDKNWGKSDLEARLKADSLSKTVPNSDSLNKKPGTRPSHALKDYAGKFENKGYGIVTTFIERDTLWIDFNEGGKKTTTYLEHYHYDVFRIIDAQKPGEVVKDGFKIQFHSDVTGNIDNLTAALEPAVTAIQFTKLPSVIEVNTNDLQKYVGSYDLEGSTVTVYIRNNKTLMVLVPGQPDYELAPASEHQFNLVIAKGFSVKFDVNDKKEVTALSFIQPNGVFKANRKK